MQIEPKYRGEIITFSGVSLVLHRKLLIFQAYQPCFGSILRTLTGVPIVLEESY